MRNARIRLAVLAAAGLLVSGLGTTGAATALADPSPAGAVVTAVPKPTTKSSTTLVVAPSMATRLHRARVSLKALGRAAKHIDARDQGLAADPSAVRIPARFTSNGMQAREGSSLEEGMPISIGA